MRKNIVWISLVMIVAVSGYGLAVWKSGFEELRTKVKTLSAETDSLKAWLRTSEDVNAELQQQIILLHQTNQAQSAQVEVNTNVAVAAPRITVDGNGKKTYFFSELYGNNGQIIGRDAQFRELIGHTKFSFRTADGIRYYDLENLHPSVIASLGYDAGVLRARMAEELRHMRIRGAQAQLQQELRTKAAIEMAEREKAEAERIKAEASLREAVARERLADAAERAATNPPKPPRITQKVIVGVPYEPDKPKTPEG